jgi:hypothetical protein
MLTLYASKRSTADPQKQEQEVVLRVARDLAVELLFKRILELIEIYGTKHQKEVFLLWIGDPTNKRTYQNIGQILGANYSCRYSAYTAISHAIKGIKSKKHNKHHGGIENKLRKKCAKDEVCQELLEDMALISTDFQAAIEFLSKHDPWYKNYKVKKSYSD